MSTKSKSYIFGFVAIFCLLLSTCTTQVQGDEDGLNSQPAPTDVWSALLEVTPVPYASPLPKAEKTELDGTYARFDPAPPQWWSCLRCADYRPAGGVWRLQFDKGVMRIYYEVTGWNSLASYSVSDDRLYLFNDPYCKEATGEYIWKQSNGELILEVVEDLCSFQLRGWNLSGGVWESCPAVDTLAVKPPRGCADASYETFQTPILPDGLEVMVHQADVRFGPQKPEILLYANGSEPSTMDGIKISSSLDSIPYGTNRVVWKDSDWMEVTSNKPFDSMGVQFRGDYVIGWARVLFDGQEIWRGDTSRIWSEGKIHGGYIEVSGFEEGEHSLRVERLGLDSRPVVVAFFGLNP